MMKADGDLSGVAQKRFDPTALPVALLRPGQWVPIVLSGLGLLAVANIAAALYLPYTVALAVLAASATLVVMWAGGGAWAWLARGRRQANRAMTELLDMSAVPSLVTGADFRVLNSNAAAKALFRSKPGDNLRNSVALTNTGLETLTLMGAEVAQGATQVTRQILISSEGWRVTSRPLAGGRIVWQLHPVLSAEESADTLPILTLDRHGTLSEANAYLTNWLGRTPDTLRDILGRDDVPRSGSTLTVHPAEGEGKVIVVDLNTDPDARQIALVPLTAQTDSAGQGATGWDGFEDLPVSLLWISPEGKLLRANRSATRLMGRNCAPGAELADLTEGLGRPIADWIDEAMSGFRPNTPEFLRVNGSDKETFVQMTLSPYTRGDETAILAVVHDATELKTLEGQFVQSQKMHAIGQLAGGVAHDFNNLLTAISGHCDLLLLRHDQGDPEYADLMQINQNSNRAAALVNQLLAFSRKQTLRPEDIDLRDTLSDLTHLLNRLVGEKIALSFSHDRNLGAIRADKRQLEQVMMNLVVNARDAIRGTGEIRIVTERVTFDAVQTRDAAQVPPGDYVSVKVIDTGCGIPPDRLTKVFEPFYTTKKVGEGTGLGLSTVYGIIKQTGGFIFAESTLGQGTCFTLLFRATKRDQKTVTGTSSPSANPAKHADGVVLLVEDEAPVRAFASRALRLRGYTVIEADSGEEALKTLEDTDLKIDIFVTDVVMPGMDGPTWVRQALVDRPDVRVIFMSGYAEDHFGDDKNHIPNSVFLPKPFSLAELTETVQNA